MITKNQKLRLELPLLLPDIPDARDHCVGSLIAALTGRTGISEAHVAELVVGRPNERMSADQCEPGTGDRPAHRLGWWSYPSWSVRIRQPETPP